MAFMIRKKKNEMNLPEYIEEDMLSAQEIADRFKKSVRWVYRHGFELGGFKIGGSWFFTERGLADAIQRGQKMEGKGYGQWPTVHEIKRYQKRGRPVGSEKEERAGIRRDAIELGLINADGEVC